LASSGADRITQVVDLAPPKGATSNPSLELAKHSSDVTYASFSPDNRSIVTVSRDQTAVVWSLPRGKPVATPLLHTHKVGIRAGFGQKSPFSSDSPGVVTAGEDGTARVWDALTGRPIAVFQHRNEVIRAVLVDGGTLTTLSFVEHRDRRDPKYRHIEVTRWK